LGRAYSDNGRGAQALTGGKKKFRVKEMEVYEVVDLSHSPADLFTGDCGGDGGFGGVSGGVDEREQWLHTINKVSADAVTVSIGPADSGARIAHALSAEGPLGSWVAGGMDPSLVEGEGECVSLETELLYRGSRDGYTQLLNHHPPPHPKLQPSLLLCCARRSKYSVIVHFPASSRWARSRRLTKLRDSCSPSAPTPPY